MYKDLKIVRRPSRKKPGMKECFILILFYSYYNKNAYSAKNDFSLSQRVLADYFNCTERTVRRWFEKLRDLGFLTYSERDDAGKTVYYKVKDDDGNSVKVPYVIPKYKRIHCGKQGEVKFINVYSLDQQGLNSYLMDTVHIDVLSNIEDYKTDFDNYISFLSNRNVINTIRTVDDLEEIQTSLENTELSNKDKRALKRAKILCERIEENRFYLDKKIELEISNPDFICKYLDEGCFRLTHELCSTVNPEHTEKINENNYWRSSHVRYDMLKKLLHTSDINDIVEYDVNGSIYRLTYNLFHDKPLGIHTDIYKLIWNNCKFNIDWPDEYDRKLFKAILMPIYMKSGSISYKAQQYDYIRKYYDGHPRKYKRLPKDQREFYEMHKVFIEMTGLDISTFLTTIRDAMYKTLNVTKFLGSDIFIQESNLHILMREKFDALNIRTANIYDGFYFIKNDIAKVSFYSIYDEALAELKTNLANGIGTSISRAI